MSAIITTLFGTTTACVVTAIVAALIALVLFGYTVHRYRSGAVNSEIQLVTWARWVIIGLFGLLVIAALIMAVRASGYTPPADDPPQDDLQTEEDSEYFEYYSLSQEKLDELYPDASIYLDDSSLPSQASARRDAIKEAYGITWTGSVGMPILTKAEVEEIRAMPAGEERDAALAAASYEAQVAAIDTLIPAMQHLEWLSSEEYFTRNNDWIVQGYDLIKQTLTDPNPDAQGRLGWDKFLTRVETPMGVLYKVDTDLHYLVMRVESVINCAEVRGIETLKSSTRWYLNEASDDQFAFPIRTSEESEHENMFALIYDFSHKSQDGGKTSVPKYLVGIDTADQSFCLYELAAKEGSPKPSGGNPPSTGQPKEPPTTTPSTPVEKDPPPITVITPDPVTETHRVIQHYVDEDGREIVAPVTQTTPVHAGAKWKAEFKDLSGKDENYKLSYTTTDNGGYWDGNSMYTVSGIMPDCDLNVYFHYEAQNAHIVIKYVDEKGKALSGRDYVGIDVWEPIGTRYRYVSPTSNPDYGVPDIEVVAGTLTRKGVNETVTYRKSNSTVLIYIRNNETGNTMPGYSNPIKLTGRTGTRDTYTAPTIHGWQPDRLSISIVYNDGETYTIWYSRLPADGQGAKNPTSSSSKNPGTTDGNGSNTNDSNHTSEEQVTKPKEEEKPIVPGSNGSKPLVDSSGPSGAGDQSTTKGDTTGTGAPSNPTIKDPQGGSTNGGTLSKDDEQPDPVHKDTTATVTTPNNTGGTTSVTGNTSGDYSPGVVGDID